MHNEGYDNLFTIYDNISSQMLLVILKIIYNIVNKIYDFIMFLSDFHVPIMLNNILNTNSKKEKIIQQQKRNDKNVDNSNGNYIRLNNAEFIEKINPEVKRACLKLFKCQIKFLNKALETRK